MYRKRERGTRTKDGICMERMINAHIAGRLE